MLRPALHNLGACWNGHDFYKNAIDEPVCFDVSRKRYFCSKSCGVGEAQCIHCRHFQKEVSVTVDCHPCPLIPLLLTKTEMEEDETQKSNKNDTQEPTSSCGHP